MIKTTLARIKRALALALASRGRGDLRNFPGKFHKLPVSVLKKAEKTSKSVKDEQVQCEQCKQLIDYIFGQSNAIYGIRKTETKLINQVHAKPETQCEKCDRLITKAFGEDVKRRDISETTSRISLDEAHLRATTAKQTEEQLAQKIEVIEETPLVEAEKKEIEGFNTQPRLLGHIKDVNVANDTTRLVCKNEHSTMDENIITRQKIEASVRRIENAHLLKQDATENRYTIPVVKATDYSMGNVSESSTQAGELRSFDAIATRCLSTPTSHIDERLLKEMKTLGVPQTVSHLSNSATEKQIIQMGVSKKPQEPVEKAQMELETRKLQHNLTIASKNIESRDLNTIFKTRSCPINNLDDRCRYSGQTVSQRKVKQVENVVDTDPRPEFDPERPIIEPYDKRSIAFDTEDYGYGPIKDYIINYVERKPQTESQDRAAIKEGMVQNLINPELIPNDKNYEPVVVAPAAKMEQKTPMEEQTATNFCSLPNIAPENSQPSYGSSSRQQFSHSFVRPETTAHPLTQKKTLIDTKIQSNLSQAVDVLPKLNPEGEKVPLSEMLKRVRLRNREEFCRAHIRHVDPVEGKCGRTSPPCPPPAPTCPIPNPCPPPPCPPRPPPCPRPCKPSCPSPCAPTSPSCPPPAPTCPPTKNPCARFKSTFAWASLYNFKTLVYNLSAINLPKFSFDAAINHNTPQTMDVFKKAVLAAEVVQSASLQNIMDCSFLPTYRQNIYINLGEYSSSIILARGFDPWVPIPSWPIPKKREKKPYVCPKEGCKLIPPPRIDAPCHRGCAKEIPCTTFPKRSNFSLAELLLFSLKEEDVAYDVEELCSNFV